MTSGISLGLGEFFQIKLFNTTTPSGGGSGIQINSTETLTSTTQSIRVQNFSSTLDPAVPNYLQVQLVASGLNNGYANNSWFLTVSFY